eukprot:gene5327-12733_t
MSLMGLWSLKIEVIRVDTTGKTVYFRQCLYCTHSKKSIEQYFDGALVASSRRYTNHINGRSVSLSWDFGMKKLMEDGGFSVGSPSSQPAPAIIVAEPNREGEGVASFISYKVHSSNCPQGVSRRYSDFTWLQQKLQEKNKKLQEKNKKLQEKNKVFLNRVWVHAHAFAHAYAHSLTLPPSPQVFLNRVLAHAILKQSHEFTTFLTAKDENWILEMARWQDENWILEMARPQAERNASKGPAAESNASKGPAVSGALQWLKGLSFSAQNIVSGRTLDSLEDTEYIKVRDLPQNHCNGLKITWAIRPGRQVDWLKRKLNLSLALSQRGLAVQHST